MDTVSRNDTHIAPVSTPQTGSLSRGARRWRASDRSRASNGGVVSFLTDAFAILEQRLPSTLASPCGHLLREYVSRQSRPRFP
jgi:hypothetical protein